MKFFGFLLILFLSVPAFSIKLNYPRVLLPVFDKLSINFTLEVIEGGCFKWTSNRADLITITPLYDVSTDPECSSKAVVTTRSRERRRHTALVLAEDIATSEILRCDVIVDIIDQLGVLTTTRELYLEEAPETFELIATDSQGNAFTTLEGIEFNWRITSQNEDDSNDWQQVLRFLRFSESKYHEVPTSVKHFDQLGLRGSMVLLEGINTGSAKVSVQLPHGEYLKVAPIEVDIMVLANIILDPSEAHILVGDTITFKILQLKQGKLYDITDNNQYYLEVEHTNLASLTGNAATGNALGRTSVVLKDRNVGKQEISGSKALTPSPRATLTISKADKITVNLLPHYNWVTVEGERHTIAIDLRTHDDQLITLGSKYRVASLFDETVFFKLDESQNGSRVDGETIKAGSSQVTGSYDHLRAKAELLVYKAINLTPAKVVLPYDPSNTKRHRIQYTATGGDGSFIWASSNPNAVSIAQNGLAEANLDNLHQVKPEHDDGEAKVAQVKVALQRNNKIAKTAEILFLPPVKLEIVKYNFETTVKDYIFVHVALYAYHRGEYLPFTSCDNLNFDLNFSNEIFYVDNNAKITANVQLYPSACRIVALRATNTGTSNLKVTYTFADQLLQDEVSLIVFDKLDILSPISNEVVLPIGSSINVIYYNGPQKVYSLDAELTSKVKVQKSIAAVTRITNELAADKHVFQILCKEIGETALNFQIYNVLSKANVAPYISEFKTNILCVKPRFINLYTTEKLRDSCPMKLKTSLMHVKPNENNLDIAIEVLDAENRKLMNISSLVIDWKFTQLESGEQNNDVKYRREVEEDIISGIRVPRRDYLITSIPHIENNFKIKAIVTTYDKKLLGKYGIVAEKPEFGIRKDDSELLHKPIIENELNFQAVNSSLLPFNDLAIFLSSNRVERVKITQGSGFYDVKLSEEGIISVEFDAATRELLIRPLRVGKVQVDLIDRCLVTDANRLTVSVVSVSQIKAQVPDRVQISKSIEAIVTLYDTFNDPLSLDYNSLEIYDIHEHIFNINILNVELGQQSGLGEGEVRYVIRGNELGETKIEFGSGFGDKKIASDAFSIQVFPPLRLHPRNSTIIIGSNLQIYSQGGPYPDVKIVYTIQNENIASIDSSVLIAHRLGSTTVTGRCVGVNPITAQPVVYSEDSIQVTVVPLERVKIKTPLLRIRSGAVMPATIWGAPNISPMILGTLPTLSVSWSTENTDIVDILGIFSDAGVEYADKDSISVRIKALNPGKARIVATVITPNGRQSCSIEVVVFKMLELESPRRITSDAILVPPQAQINLKANIPDATFKLASENSNSILRVSRDGILETNDALGRELIIASSDDQTLSIPIEVKNIHYVLATLETPTIKLRNVEPILPSGINLVLKVALYDNLGNEFSHNLQDINRLKHTLARRDAVDLNVGENFTISINLPRETSNMLAISLKNSFGVKYESDFIKLAVGKSTNNFPTKKIFSVGDIICFDSPLASTSNWATSNNNIIQVDAHLGVGFVTASGDSLVEQVSITNGNKKNGFIEYDLEIRDADKIAFFKSSDIFNGENYKGHVLIKNHLQIEKVSNVIARNATKCAISARKTPENIFICSLQLINGDNSNLKILDYFKVNAVFDKLYGAYACEISTHTSLNDLITIVNDLELNFELEARLKNGISASTHLKMVPAIAVTPRTIPVDQVSATTITITGLDKILQKVTVSTSDASVLEVTLLSKIQGTHQYKAQLHATLPIDSTVYVVIRSPLSAQTIQIPISTPVIAQKCLNQPLQNMSSVLLTIVSNLGLILSTLIVLAATVWVFIYCYPKNGTSSHEFSPLKSKNQIPPGLLYHPPPFDHSRRGPVYPSSPFFDQNRSNTSHGSPNSSAESPVYGDSTIISPNKRINQRYI